jgi:hypothetical protein
MVIMGWVRMRMRMRMRVRMRVRMRIMWRWIWGISIIRRWIIWRMVHRRSRWT